MMPPDRGLRMRNVAVTVTIVLPKADPFEALGDAHRREILQLLSRGDLPVGRIADALPISRPAVSRHLRLLKEAGLVAERAEGTRRIYHLQDQGIEAVQAYLETVWGDAAARFRLVAENTSRRPR
jgi:DNA-binding transcriptional ArsR family regulator